MHKYFVLLLFLFFIPVEALAHQPRIVTENIINVQNPEISQAFYGELTGPRPLASDKNLESIQKTL